MLLNGLDHVSIGRISCGTRVRTGKPEMVGEAADMLRKVDRGGLIPDGWLLTLHAQGLIEYRVKTGWTLSKKGKDAIK